MAEIVRKTPGGGAEGGSGPWRRAGLVGVGAVLAGGLFAVAAVGDEDGGGVSAAASEMSARAAAAEEPPGGTDEVSTTEAPATGDADAPATGDADGPGSGDADEAVVDGPGAGAGAGAGDDADEVPGRGPGGPPVGVPGLGRAGPPGDVPAPVEVGVGRPADTGRGVVVDVVAVEVVQARGGGPGDIGGEAWRVDVELSNRSGGVVDLGAVVLTADLVEGRPVSPVSGDPEAEPFEGEVGPGRSARGSYLFTVPPGAGDELRLSFSYDVAAPVAVFTGSPDDV